MNRIRKKCQFEINTFDISKIMNAPLFFNSFSHKFVVFDNMRNIYQHYDHVQ